LSWTEKVSIRIARKIRPADSPYSVGQISHGIEIVLLYLFNAAALLLSALWLDVFWEAVGLAGFYILHRLFTGGIHFRNAWTCLLTGVSTMIAGAVLVKYSPDLGNVSYVLLNLMLMASFWMNARYAPAEHTYVSTDPRIKKISRGIILSIIPIGCIFCNILLVYEYNQLAITYAFASLLQAVHVHPVSFRVIARIENLFREG